MFDNIDNPKYVFVIGNCEARMRNEVLRRFDSGNTNKMWAWFGGHAGYTKNKNIANIVIEEIENGTYTYKQFIDMTEKLRWYYHEKIGTIDWIMSHASWQTNKSPQAQSKLNLIYDSDNFLQKLKKSDYQPKILPIYKNTTFVFGHTPVENISRVNEPPVILKDKFFYIDNGIFRTKNKVFFLKIGK